MLHFDCLPSDFSSESSWRLVLVTVFGVYGFPCPFGATQWRLLRPLAHVRLSGAISLSVRDAALPWPAGFWWRPTSYVPRLEHERDTLVLGETDFVGCLFVFFLGTSPEPAELPQAFLHPGGIGCLPLRPWCRDAQARWSVDGALGVGLWCCARLISWVGCVFLSTRPEP